LIIKKQFQIITFVIFLLTLSISIIATISVLFPALIIRTFGELTDYSGINPFETGVWANYWIITNMVFLGLFLIYKRKYLSNKTNKLFNFILKFEISPRIAFCVITIILCIYVVLSAHELFEEEIWDDYKLGHKEVIENWRIDDITKSYQYHVKFFLHYMSMKLFGNYKVIPFLSSISLLILVYYVTKEFTRKRFAGIVSLVIVLQSGTFLVYDTSITYDNYWVLFYLLSLYLINKAWPLSPVSFILSVLSKPLSVIFLPMTIFVTYNSNISRKNKIFVMASYLGMGITGSFLTNGFEIKSILTSFAWHDFWMAFSGISYQIRYDGLILVLLLPLTIALYYKARNGLKYANSIMVLIFGSISSQPILAAITIDSSEPYRFMPFVVFFAIGVGALLSKPKLVESV
jgi:hypothetical protein